jgi:hypothetical protein
MILKSVSRRSGAGDSWEVWLTTLEHMASTEELWDQLHHCSSYSIFFFAVLGFELRAYSLSHTPPALFL